LWFTEYCGSYEGLVDVRYMLNMTREADRIRNDLAVGPASAALIDRSRRMVSYIACRAIRLS